MKTFLEKGFLVVKQVFTADEANALRRKAYLQIEENERSNLLVSRTAGKPIRGELLSKRHLRELILDERIQSIAQELLGSVPIYFGDSNYQVGQVGIGLRGWHKDNRKENRATHGPDWEGRYSLIRLGIYLQPETGAKAP